MRKDMHKVTTESTRAGGKYNPDKRGKTLDKRSKPRIKDDEDQSLKQESMRKRHDVAGDTKNFTDNLGPLMRYLESQVGRQWDDVWSDVCQVLRGNGLQANHIKEHVKQAAGGIPHSGMTSFSNEDWFSDSRWYMGAVYVNEEGILCKAKNKPRRKKATYCYKRGWNPKKGKLNSLIEYHKLNGCWFECNLASYDVEKPRPYIGGVWTTTVWYISNKRALNKREAKKLKLDTHRERVAPKVTLEKK